MTGEDSAAMWTDCPRAIHNPVAIKLLVSGLLTRHMLYTSVLHHNRVFIYILISSVQVLSL